MKKKKQEKEQKLPPTRARAKLCCSPFIVVSLLSAVAVLCGERERSLPLSLAFAPATENRGEEPARARARSGAAAAEVAAASSGGVLRSLDLPDPDVRRRETP